MLTKRKEEKERKQQSEVVCRAHNLVIKMLFDLYKRIQVAHTNSGYRFKSF